MYTQLQWNIGIKNLETHGFHKEKNRYYPEGSFGKHNWEVAILGMEGFEPNSG